MNPESRWIVCLTLTGAFFGTILHNINLYLVGDNNVTTIVICVAFFVALVMSPTYLDISEYWRKRYEK